MAQSFFEIVTEAIKEFEETGFDSAERLAYWVDRIRRAAVESLVPEHVLDDTLRKTLGGIYKRLVDDGQLLKTHLGASRFTIDRLKPKLRTELDRRLMVSRNLIHLNREQAVETTVRRFAGWASSVPAGGSRAVNVKDAKDDIRKALTSLSFTERRVAIDQGHKFSAALNEIIAVDSGAIAAVWKSMWRRSGYQYRVDHKERDQKVYAIRGNWALEKGLMKAGPDGYTDQITKPGEEVYCSCTYQFLYNIRDLPDDMVTVAGKKSLEDARSKIAAMRA
jgi:hypothetical protein